MAGRWNLKVGATQCVAMFLFATHCGAPTAAHAAGPGETLLQAYLQRIETLRADFEQTLFDADREVLQQSRGTFALRRPGRFRWDYAAPAVQVIVADGERIWMYDAELEQVTVRPLDATLASTPAMLLSGRSALGDDYRIRELGEAGGLIWVGLLPSARETEFESVRLGFDGLDLAVMELADQFGQTTRIEFSDLVRNPAIDDSVFRFEPPPGNDVIGADG